MPVFPGIFYFEVTLGLPQTYPKKIITIFIIHIRIALMNDTFGLMLTVCDMGQEADNYTNPFWYHRVADNFKIMT